MEKSSENPYATPSDPRIPSAELVSMTRKCTFAIKTLLAIVLVWAAFLLATGLAALFRARQDSVYFGDSPVIPDWFQDALHRSRLREGFVNVIAAVILMVLARFLWRYAVTLRSLNQSSPDLMRLFQRQTSCWQVIIVLAVLLSLRSIARIFGIAF